MVEKSNNFLNRIMTIIIGLPLVFILIFWNEFPFIILVTIIALLGLRELYSIAHKQGQKPPYILGSVLTIYFIYISIYDFDFCNLNHYIVKMIISFLIILSFSMQLFKKNYSNVLSELSVAFFGSIYLGYLLSFMLKIKDLHNGNFYLVSLLIITWVHDAGAYIVGTKFGKIKIFPKISPKKTIEGSIGGIIFCTTITFVLKKWLNLNFTELLYLGLIISIIAQLGDLFESVLKRGSGIKDSGTLFPGHGGILDIFDSLIFTAPIFYYYINLVITN